MRANDGRKLDHQTLEVLRLRTVEQVAAGAHPEDVAATKWDLDTIDVLRQLFTTGPWLPPALRPS